MLTSELIQMLLDSQKQAGDEVELRGALLTYDDGCKIFHQCTIVGVELFHSPNTDEQHVKLIIHERPNLNGDNILAEIKHLISDGYEWQDRVYLGEKNVQVN